MITPHPKILDRLPAVLAPGLRLGVWFSSALGDTIAAMQYLEDFRVAKACKEIVVFTPYSKLFIESYPNLRFGQIPQYVVSGQPVDATAMLDQCDLMVRPYQIDLPGWREKPVQWVMTETLGVPYYVAQTRLYIPPDRTMTTRYVVIATGASGVFKEWQHQDGWGWGTVAESLMDSGYRVYDVSQNPPVWIPGVLTIDKEPIERVAQIVAGADFAIGCSSGISWLAWGLGKPVVLISGFTDAFHEFATPFRITAPKGRCHGCLHDTSHPYGGAGNVEWCPRHKDFECSRTITPEMVLRAVERLIAKHQLTRPTT